MTAASRNTGKGTLPTSKPKPLPLTALFPTLEAPRQRKRFKAVMRRMANTLASVGL